MGPTYSHCTVFWSVSQSLHAENTMATVLLGFVKDAYIFFTFLSLPHAVLWSFSFPSLNTCYHLSLEHQNVLKYKFLHWDFQMKEKFHTIKPFLKTKKFFTLLFALLLCLLVKPGEIWIKKIRKIWVLLSFEMVLILKVQNSTGDENIKFKGRFKLL